jgi:hypothetical protein
VGTQKTRNPTRMQTVKARLLRFQMGIRTLLDWTTDHSCCILANNLSTFCACPKYLNEATLKSDGLIILEEEILIQ